MKITSCGNSEKFARALAKKFKAKYVPLEISSFPDGDLYMRFKGKLDKHLVIVQSFQPDPDMSLFDIIFAAETARDLGAKKITLIAPYLAFMRQDTRFNPGESINSRVMAKLLNNSINKIITVDPHLHRYKSLKEIFTISTKKLSANPLIGHYIKKNIKNPVIIGPDEESYQWADEIAKHVGCGSTCLKKTRYSSRKVKVQLVKEIPIKGKDVVIVDDIISTGHTVAEAAKKAKKMGARTITTICVHGLFAENAVKKLQTAGVKKVISTNTIEHNTNKIDVLELITKL